MYNKKVIDISTKMIPEWLNKDIEQISRKEEVSAKPGFIISRLYNQYSPGYRHLFTAMTGNTEWALIARERLNYIDENLDLIVKHLKKRKD
ncbi:hypothetical protein ACN6MT_15845 [Neobacillus niacini]|uniref:hypothetical protein n=1 Tax=Neobacillus niacini TaxID=86668 RepID=UPI003B023821